jgi:hypothetical protein
LREGAIPGAPALWVPRMGTGRSSTEFKAPRMAKPHMAVKTAPDHGARP